MSSVKFPYVSNLFNCQKQKKAAFLRKFTNFARNATKGQSY
jgi:hypothetical protein